MIELRWHDYSYFPYERDLARRELHALLGVGDFVVTDVGVRLPAAVETQAAGMLTYFSTVEGDGSPFRTLQARLEEAARNGRNRQATRYSVHGLHEYKGKFNPQVARAILNIFGAGDGTLVLDPFCGSGTTLVECCHLGAIGTGIDVNPLAAFVANTKIQCLGTPASALRRNLEGLSRALDRIGRPALAQPRTERDAYLRSWFPEDQLAWLEAARLAILRSEHPDPFLAIASNLLRDYSLQEPGDLRIRRRSAPMPDVTFSDAFRRACEQFLDRLEASQELVGARGNGSHALLADIRATSFQHQFDMAITSPPYATALPYVDTQRLSLVWLGLVEPSRLMPLDGQLIGSREATGAERKRLSQEMHENADGLPEEQWRFCRDLSNAVGTRDGFRRQAVPALIYRYFTAMQESFRSVSKALKRGGRYALIVGHNHTVLSGERRDIDTPRHLASLANAAGWVNEESVPLETYHRYGLHTTNAIKSETLLILRNG